LTLLQSEIMNLYFIIEDDNPEERLHLELEVLKQRRYSINYQNISSKNSRRHSQYVKSKIAEEEPQESFERRYFLYNSVRKSKLLYSNTLF